MSENINVGGFAEDVDQGQCAAAYDQILAEARDSLGKSKIWILFMVTDDHFTELASTGIQPVALIEWLMFLQEVDRRVMNNFLEAVANMERRSSEED